MEQPAAGGRWPAANGRQPADSSLLWFGLAPAAIGAAATNRWGSLDRSRVYETDCGAWLCTIVSVRMIRAAGGPAVEGGRDGAGARAGSRTWSRNRRSSRSGGYSPPATAAVTVAASGTVTMPATAPVTATVPAIQTVRAVCRPAVTVRNGPSPNTTVTVAGIGTLGELGRGAE